MDEDMDEAGNDEHVALLVNEPEFVMAKPGTNPLGLFYTGLSALLFSIMSVLVKQSGTNFTSTFIVFIRSIIQAILALISCYFLNVNPFKRKVTLLAIRGFLGATSLGLYFFVLINMPLGDGTSIFFTGPALTSLLAYFLLKEPFARLDAISIISCFAGVTLVARPHFIFGVAASSKVYPLDQIIPTIAAIFGAVISAFAYILVRIVGHEVHYMCHVVSFGLASTLVSSIILLLNNGLPTHQATLLEIFKLALIGVFAFGAQAFLNKGLQLSNAGPATLMRNLDVLFAFVFGVILFDEIPLWSSIAGSILIVGTTSIIAYLKFLESVRD